MRATARGLREESLEVIYSDGSFQYVDAQSIAMLKGRASASSRRRCRLCFHASPDASHQAMLIVMHESSYVRPHRHFGKTETLTVLDGHADAVLFDADGQVTDFLHMAPVSSGGVGFYYMPERLFHTLIFRSEWLVFVETTTGPFDARMSEAAGWAPPETDRAAGLAYLAGLTPPLGREPR